MTPHLPIGECIDGVKIGQLSGHSYVHQAVTVARVCIINAWETVSVPGLKPDWHRCWGQLGFNSCMAIEANNSCQCARHEVVIHRFEAVNCSKQPAA